MNTPVELATTWLLPATTWIPVELEAIPAPAVALIVIASSVTAVLTPLPPVKVSVEPVLNESEEPESAASVNDDEAGSAQYDTEPFETRTWPAVPTDPLAVTVVITALATMTLSMPEVELATSAWFAVRVPGVLAPPIGATVPKSPIYKISPALDQANSPLARDAGTAVVSDLLI